MIKKIKKIIKTSDTSLADWLFVKYYERREKRNIKINNIKSIKDKNTEEVYYRKWKNIVGYRTPNAFKLYSHFIEKNREDIVSQVAAFKVNDILNPPQYIGYLSDKNNFDKILPRAPFPKTCLHKIGGVIYDEYYSFLQDYEIEEKLEKLACQDIIIKPSVDTDSGVGVSLIQGAKDPLEMRNIVNQLEKLILDPSLPNLIIQERVSQHHFLAQFNPTSINTIRIATYRSVVSNEVHILSTVIRLGASGRMVDNLHAGGHMVRVADDGTLSEYCIDQYGTRFNSHNGIKTKGLKLPNYEEIKILVKELSAQLYDIRLIQWDITLDEKGQPKVIEFNSNGFSMWIAQMTGTPAFGQFTDEIIKYCETRNKE